MLIILKHWLRRFVPRFVLRVYHLLLAELAAQYYGHPAEKIIVIGVTGTKGKSTTANLLAQLLEAAGYRVGLTSTATMKVADREWLATSGMTMPGRFALQRLLGEMVAEKCQYAVIETSSEGIAQHRHRGIHYDSIVLTNLSPEHIEAHGSYEKYRAEKAKLFTRLRSATTKVIAGRSVPKQVILNKDDAEYDFFRRQQAGEEWRFGLDGGRSTAHDREVLAHITSLTATGARAMVRGTELHSPFLFDFNVLNLLAAMAAAMARGIPFATLAAAVPHLKQIPGRQEFIDAGQPFSVMVDYTYEPTSMRALYRQLMVIPHERVIHVLGPTGGGRDRWRRPVLGEIAAAHAAVVVATTDDPYDDDPNELADELLAGARRIDQEGRKTELLKIIDRRAAITEACRRAKPHDLVLISGRGAEQRMAVAGGRSLPWDDRQVVRETLRLLGYRGVTS